MLEELMRLTNVKKFKVNWALIQPNFYLLLLLCVITVSANAQKEQSLSLNIGDPAPPLRVREWLKGTPVQNF